MSLHGVISRHRLRAVPDVVASPTTTPDAAIETLYREDGTRLWRAVRAYAADTNVADDAVAEAFAQLLRRGEEVREPQKWVWRGGVQDRRRRAAPPAAGRVPSRRRRSGASTRSARSTCTGRWPCCRPSQRAAVVLHDYAGYSASESARIFGSTEAAMRVHLMRGRRRLRELL